MTYTYQVAVEVDYVDGLIPVFTYQESGGNPFSIGEWADIRTSLQKELTPKIPEEFEDILGVDYQYTIGTIEVSEDGEIVSENIDTSVDRLREQLK